jgi:hypothetical protein
VKWDRFKTRVAHLAPSTNRLIAMFALIWAELQRVSWMVTPSTSTSTQLQLAAHEAMPSIAISLSRMTDSRDFHELMRLLGVPNPDGSTRRV